jgi:rare lipoprotein A
MNQKIWSGLTAATLMVVATSGVPASRASQVPSNDEVPQTDVPQEQQSSSSSSSPIASNPISTAGVSQPNVSQDLTTQNSTASTSPSEPSVDMPTEVAKVGEYQSQEETEPEETIASIQPHMMRGRQAATLYVRNIPVLTFLGSDVPTAASNSDSATDTSSGAEVKIGSTQQDAGPSETPIAYYNSGSSNSGLNDQASANTPVWRASEMAAQVNQFHLNNIDPTAITVRWDGDRQRYIIQVSGEDLLEMTPDVILPDSTNDPAEDALQATNRLRRLMGNAPPLRDIAGRPQQTSTTQSFLGAIRSQLTGMASWYGPGFHGNRSANGEVFNQNGLTAAHRSLPFGTQVRVTNLNTGQSVVVRITDRGPHARGRVIDLSAGAARVIGLINAGVAPVRLDVLDGIQTASN